MRLGLSVALIAVLLLPFASNLTEAQSGFQALTHYAVTIYSGPDRANHIVGVLAPEAKVILETRNAAANWVLGRSTDGLVRGWMEIRFLDIDPDTSVVNLLVSNEIVFVPAEVPVVRTYDEINLDQYPVIPTDLGRARQIFEQGLILGNDPGVIAKIGDCITESERFLYPFGWNRYNLGSYTNLQAVIDHFSASFSTNSLAAYDGLVTNAALDPVFSNPLACLPGESPLRCEYRVHRPAVAIIMFGAQDLLFTPPDQFDRNLRQIVHETIQAGIIPILSTFPGNLALWEPSIQYNQIVIQIAVDYQIPLINLWRALETLPNYGLNDDGRHLSVPVTEAGHLTPENLARGYPMRNLVTLQTLDVVWREAMY
ncbi:MAG: SGNH/GDSL hydrolase family protein [Chloroflexi bacterium]|nr:SGNH/GDSL hydrolase family protein [Chloroflexota bacterium]